MVNNGQDTGVSAAGATEGNNQGKLIKRKKKKVKKVGKTISKAGNALPDERIQSSKGGARVVPSSVKAYLDVYSGEGHASQ